MSKRGIRLIDIERPALAEQVFPYARLRFADGAAETVLGADGRIGRLA